MLAVTMLPARQGDAIWLRWGDAGTPHQLLVDMGTEEAGKLVRQRIFDLDEAERIFDLLVVTHVDRDHIGGVLSCLAEADPIPGLTIRDVWFNGYPHLTGGIVHTGLEPMGPAQGERLASWLKTQVWNAAFDGRAVVRAPDRPLTSMTLHDGLTLKALGPMPERLTQLAPVWKEEVAEALRKGTLTTVSPGLEPMGPKVPPILEDLEDLRQLAATPTLADDSEANGSTITLLLEYRNRRVLLAGDAIPEDLIAGIAAASPAGRLHQGTGGGSGLRPLAGFYRWHPVSAPRSHCARPSRFAQYSAASTARVQRPEQVQRLVGQRRVARPLQVQNTVWGARFRADDHVGSQRQLTFRPGATPVQEPPNEVTIFVDRAMSVMGRRLGGYCSLGDTSCRCCYFR